jgi:hypothetical protein
MYVSLHVLGNEVWEGSSCAIWRSARDARLAEPKYIQRGPLSPLQFVLGVPVSTDFIACVCIGNPIGTRVVPQFTTKVAEPLTQ